MIRKILEEPVNLGTTIECEYCEPLQKTSLTQAWFKIGMRNTETGKVRQSHLEPIKPSYMPTSGLEIMGRIEADLRDLWTIMCDEEQYGEQGAVEEEGVV